MTQAYPLAWPVGWPRTLPRNQADARNKWGRGEGRNRRSWTFSEARDELYNELERFGATGLVVSTNFKLTQYGLPSKNFGVPDDQGVAIYFSLQGKPMVMAQDGYTRAEENLRALSLVLKYLRGIEELGGGAMMEKAFEGFAALPPPGSSTAESWWSILQVSPSATEPEIRTAYRKQAMKIHQNGGDDQALSALNVARDEALKAMA